MPFSPGIEAPGSRPQPLLLNHLDADRDSFETIDMFMPGLTMQIGMTL
jgi:hypothetical protein